MPVPIVWIHRRVQPCLLGIALQVTLRQQVEKFVHIAFCTLLSTRLRLSGTTAKLDGGKKKKVECRGMNNEEWLYSAHSVFIERKEGLWCAQRYGNTPTPLPGGLTRMFLCPLGTKRMYSFWYVRLTEESVLLANVSSGGLGKLGS